jgi:tetratricopeptide (TPR) repeat protein
MNKFNGFNPSKHQNHRELVVSDPQYESSAIRQPRWMIQGLWVAALLCSSVLTSAQAISLPSTSMATRTQEDFSSVVSPQPVTAADFYNRGLALEGAGHLELALADFNQAIALKPNDPDYLFSRGLTYADLGDQNRAIQDFNQALLLDNRFAAAYYQRGVARIAIPVAQVNDPADPTLSPQYEDEVAAAIADFTAATQLEPEFVAAFYQRGLAHYLQGDEALARQDYAIAQQLNPQVAAQFYDQGFPRTFVGGD